MTRPSFLAVVAGSVVIGGLRLFSLPTSSWGEG
jgi:hypothetical protein